MSACIQYHSPALPVDVSVSASPSILPLIKKSAFEHYAVKECLTIFFAPANLCLYPSDFERN